MANPIDTAIEEPNDIFISFNTETQNQEEFDYALDLRYKLEKLNYKLAKYLLYDKNDLSFPEKCENYIKNSHVFLCCLSKSYADSEICKKQIFYAFSLKKQMIVVSLENLDPVHLSGIGFIISSILRVNFFETSDCFDQIEKNVKVSNTTKCHFFLNFEHASKYSKKPKLFNPTVVNSKTIIEMQTCNIYFVMFPLNINSRYFLKNHLEGISLYHACALIISEVHV